MVGITNPFSECIQINYTPKSKNVLFNRNMLNTLGEILSEFEAADNIFSSGEVDELTALLLLLLLSQSLLSAFERHAPKRSFVVTKPPWFLGSRMILKCVFDNEMYCINERNEVTIFQRIRSIGMSGIN